MRPDRVPAAAASEVDLPRDEADPCGPCLSHCTSVSPLGHVPVGLRRSTWSVFAHALITLSLAARVAAQAAAPAASTTVPVAAAHLEARSLMSSS
jgi:hypothetical protein